MSAIYNLSKMPRCSLNIASKSFGTCVRNCYYSSASKDTKECGDIETHTGQAWAADDPRMARFLVAPKQVNRKWSMNLVKEVPSIAVKSRVAACDGGPSLALGHPKIFINLDEPGPQACIYCGQKFHKESSH